MKKQLKKQAASILAASMVLSGGVVYAESGTQPVVISAPISDAQLISAPISDAELISAPISDAQLISAPISDTQVISSQYSVIVNDLAIATAGFMNEDKHIMVPLREVSEALGFNVTWHQDQQSAEIMMEGTAIWTTVKPDVDQYAYNKMNVTLGASPLKLSGKLYVPASFFTEILRSQVVYEGNQVNISFQNEDVKMVTQQGVITSVNNDEKYKSVQMNGTGVEGTILNIDEETIIRNSAGEQVDFSELTLGMSIEVKHSLAMTMSLPGQTYAYEISVLDAADTANMLGTSGAIEEVRQDDDGNLSIVVNGMGMSEVSPEQVVLRINDETTIVDIEGNAVDAKELTKDAKVLAYYGPMLTKSLPPIGHAWKIVYLGS